MRELNWDEFAGAEGTTYAVTGETGGSVPLTLEKAVELPSSGRTAGSFRLEFRGPSDPVLPQAIYRFSNGEERMEMFIVPLARSDNGTIYEAVFY